MAVEHYKALRPQTQAQGEVTILSSRKHQAVAALSQSTNTQPAAGLKLKHRS